MNRFRIALLCLAVFVAGCVLARIEPRVARADFGVDHEGPFTTIPSTTSNGTTKVLLAAAPSDTGSSVFLQGQLYCDNASTTVCHNLKLWSFNAASSTYTQIGGVIPLSASVGSPRTSVGGFCEDERGGARRTLVGEALYYSIDSGGTGTDVSVSGAYTTGR